MIAMCKGDKYQEDILKKQRDKQIEFFSGGKIQDIKYGVWHSHQKILANNH